MSTTLKLEKLVKSLYIFKHIFSFLYENKKLNLIIYNKRFQKKLDIDIEYYQEKSGIYKTADKNGKGKEYKLDTSILIFEGEYKNGKKNGKGKEYYDDGILKFEGEYLNGKRLKGKEYNNDGVLILELENERVKEYYGNSGKLKFEGEFLNGKRWNGKLYDFKGNEEYEIKNGNGYLKEYDYSSRLIFEGEYLNGERNGKGKESLINDFHLPSEFYDKEKTDDLAETKNKLIFEGEYLNGKRWNGKLYDYKENKEYEIKNGKGYIREYDYTSGLIFEGEFKNGERNGKGKETIYNDRIRVFEGEYLNGKR